MSKLKESLEDRIKLFNRVGLIGLCISALTFFGYFVSLILDLPAPTRAVAYFTNIFFIIFPTIVAFTAYRQSNLKSAELEKINEKLLNSNYLVASLQAVQKISKEHERDSNVLSSINKLIDSILDIRSEDKAEEKDISLTASELSGILKNVATVVK